MGQFSRKLSHIVSLSRDTCTVWHVFAQSDLLYIVKFNNLNRQFINAINYLSHCCVYFYVFVALRIIKYIMNVFGYIVGWTNCTSHLIKEWPHRYRGSSTGERS